MATAVRACGWEFSSEKIASAAQLGAVNIRKPSFTNADAGLRFASLQLDRSTPRSLHSANRAQPNKEIIRCASNLSFAPH